MSWLWLNIPLATVFFLATTMIPLWLVGPAPEAATETAARARRAAERTARVPARGTGPSQPRRTGPSQPRRTGLSQPRRTGPLPDPPGTGLGACRVMTH